jgi:glycosyltransferase involved in cell wall biosynthesis
MTRTSFEPLISIIIPNYNYGRFLGQAIESALSQDYANLEVLVIDNASTDESRTVIERYVGSPRFSAHFNDTNIGRNKNCNRGLELARGEYITLLSSDDYYVPGAIAQLVAFLRRHAECDVVYANAAECDANGRTVRISRLLGHIDVQEYAARNTAAALINFTSYMWLPTCLVKRATMLDFGGFDLSFEVGCDYALHCRMAFAGIRFGFLNEVLACIRFHGENPSGSGYMESGLSLREFVRVFDELLRGENLIRLRGEEALCMRSIETQAAARGIHPKLAQAYADLGPTLREIAQRLDDSAREQRSFPVSALRPQPLASIIITRSHDGSYADLMDTIDSSGQQTYDAVEIIVVDQGPVDAMRLMERALPHNARYVRYTGTGGAPAARNAGAQLSGGDLLVFLSERALLGPRYIADATQAIIDADSDVAICSFDVALEDASTMSAARRSDVGRRTFSATADVVSQLPVAPCIPIEAFLVRRSAFIKSNQFIEQLGNSATWLFEISAALSGTVAIVSNANLTLRLRTDFSNWGFGAGLSALNEMMSAIYSRVTAPAGSPVVAGRDGFVSSLGSATSAFRQPGDVTRFWKLLDVVMCTRGTPSAVPVRAE